MFQDICDVIYNQMKEVHLDEKTAAQETILTINEEVIKPLLDNLDENIDILTHYCHELAEEYNICSSCGNVKLGIISKEDREYMGFPSEETFIDFICPVCK